MSTAANSRLWRRRHPRYMSARSRHLTMLRTFERRTAAWVRILNVRVRCNWIATMRLGVSR